MTVPPEAVTAAAEFIHDEECNGGDIRTCGRWKAGSTSERSHHAGHVEFYRDRARALLEAAAPHLAAAERERIRQLAIEREAVCKTWKADHGSSVIGPFADLLEPAP